MYKLVISDDEGKTIIVPLVRDLITVGRQEGNTIRLTERNVSRQHARLVRTENLFRVEDLDAYNGVRVNDQVIKGSIELNDGDRVGIGDYTLALRQEDEAAVTTTEEGKTPPAPPSAAVSSGKLPARLVMVSAPAPGAEFSLTKDLVRVGRLEELDMCISHRSISREHAELTSVDTGFHVQDLDSANGVRVNGSLIKEALLTSGDLLDLGQVRFRFVGEGEAYQFDADEVQAAPITLPTSNRNKTLAVVGVAVVLAVALAMSGDEEPDGPVPNVAMEADVVEGTTADARAIAAQVAAALDGCRTSVGARQYDAAIKSAQNGLMLDEGNVDLQTCRNAAQAAGRESDAFAQGKAAFEGGDIDAAYLLFAGLPADSAYRRDPVVTRAIDAYARGQLDDAQARLGREPDEAARIAGEVLEIGGASQTLHDEAAALRAKAESAAPFPAAAPSPKRSRKAARAAAPKAAPAALSDSPAKMARSCLARGDQKCAVRALEGRARTAQELALLIETYRALGDTRRAVRNMELFVQRYPSARQATQYKKFIARNGK